ncbi:MAG: S1C family serine protease [Deltaproteobacteria bacterium]
MRPMRAPASGVNWLVVILLILVAAFLWRERGGRFQGANSELHNPEAREPPVVPRGDLAEDEKSTIALFKQAAPSVVHITSLAVQRDPLSLDVLGIPQGTGSGFIWDAQGYVVTNYHVIEKAGAAKVTLADRSVWDARLVGVARDKDLAVLKIDAPEDKLSPIQLGTSANLQVGQKVFVIGNPFGLDQTLTTGIISGLGREILSLTKRPIQGVIQTDAAVNPGNSGGPLLDSAGLLIGVNTAIYSPSGASAGIAYAVPVDTVRWIVPQIIRFGKVERVGIGVSIWDDQVTARLGVRGVLVHDVAENGPAAQAGILPTRRANDRYIPGDLIVAVNGKVVDNSLDLYRILDQFKAGDTVTLTISRDGVEKNVPVTLRVLPDEQ